MILYCDEHIVVVNKPTGIPVHRSRLVNDDKVFLIDQVRALVDGPLHLIHRLDRATSGVLLIGRNAEVAGTLGRHFMQRDVVEISPETGRYRQIRRHFAHLRHPLIGDTSHGRTEHNRLFKQYYSTHRLLLHAWRLQFDHPVEARRMSIEAPLDVEFAGLLARFEWILPDCFDAPAGRTGADQ